MLQLAHVEEHIELPPFYRVHTQFPMPGVSPPFSGSGATVH